MIAQPLAKAFTDAGIHVWIDESKIEWGESVIGKINDGLAKSRFVVLVLSENFLKKKWPIKEMNAVLNREITSGVTCALVLIVGDEKQITTIRNTYPLLTDKRFLVWSPSDIGAIVSALKSKLIKII